MTTVVAGLIERDGLVLICQRRAGQQHPLKWEFPGGKVEAGEEPGQALRRELNEELGVEIEAPDEIARFDYQYPDRDPILLIFFRVRHYLPSLENRIFAEVRWVKPADLPQFDFLEGDVAFVRQLAAGAYSAQ